MVQDECGKDFQVILLKVATPYASVPAFALAIRLGAARHISLDCSMSLKEESGKNIP